MDEKKNKEKNMAISPASLVATEEAAFPLLAGKDSIFI
jgi:hypothetical protein